VRFNAPSFGGGASFRLLRLHKGVLSSTAGSADAQSNPTWQQVRGVFSAPPVVDEPLICLRRWHFGCPPEPLSLLHGSMLSPRVQRDSSRYLSVPGSLAWKGGT
jgi:hypothetical protein